jgi:hypothetical protein
VIQSAVPQWIQSADVPGNSSRFLQPDGTIVVRVQHRQTGAVTQPMVWSYFDSVQLIGREP